MSDDMLTRWKRAVEGLTPGGSEFADDPERCARFIKDRCQYPRQIIELRDELARLRTLNGELLAALEAGNGWKKWAEVGGGYRDAFLGWLKDANAALLASQAKQGEEREG